MCAVLAPLPLPPRGEYPFRGNSHERGIFIKTRKLAIDAVLAAMCAVLGAVSLDFGNLKITFESLPVLLGAIMFGPIDGLAIGGIGTLIYQLLRYGVTLTTPLWILPYLICGALVGYIARRHEYKPEGSWLAASVFAASLLIFALNTVVLYIDSKLFGYYSPVYIFGSMLPRLLICLVKAAAFTAVLPTLARAAGRVLRS